MHPIISDHCVQTKYWHALDDGRIQCDLCPRFCKLGLGQRGLCFVRKNQDHQIVMTSYGRSSGFAIDPIEKKPLNHFYPGSSVLSFGTAGCNLACKFCQNWDISKSTEMDALMQQAEPETIVEAALANECRSVAFTYNDPVVFHEYAIDTAYQCRERGINNIAVSAGYVTDSAREEFYSIMDAANIDLKSFNEQFYHRLTGSHLEPVLETIQYIRQQTQVWLELTTLLIPGENDSEQECSELCEWVYTVLGPDVPLHFTAFHPDWKMRDKPRTPVETLLKAREIARRSGLHYVYIGNAHDKQAASTYCHQCGHLLIRRDWYELSEWNLNEYQCCVFCGARCAGLFDATAGSWGRKRQILDLKSSTV